MDASKTRALQALLSWLPAVILPTATADQLVAILLAESVEGVSALTWGLFLLANVGSIALAWPRSRRALVQVSLAFGLTGILDVAILVAIAVYR